MFAIKKSDNKFYECNMNGDLDLNRPLKKADKELIGPDPAPKFLSWIENDKFDISDVEEEEE